MKKPERLGIKLGILAGFGILVTVWYFFDLPCVPRFLTGIPCPTCGLTRAWLCAFRLDFQGAFLQYPMFWSLPILLLYLFFDGKVFRNTRFNNLFLFSLAAGIFLIWLARILGFLGALSPL